MGKLTSLPGNSSANIELHQMNDGVQVVKKSCRGAAGKRLVLQIEKQKSFQNSNTLRTPQVFNVIQLEDRTDVLMEYVRGSDFVSYTNCASFDEFSKTIEILTRFVKKEFESSKMTKFPVEVWKSKIEQVLLCSQEKQIFKENEQECIASFLLDSLPSEILQGTCHGDFTFSNVIVERYDKLCLFDFLDPPIETPYEDLAKFLQDAQFFWSLLKYTSSCDKTRVMIYWEFAARYIKNELSDLCNHELLRKFQVLGLLRILPYTSDAFVIKYLRSNILCEVMRDISPTMRR